MIQILYIGRHTEILVTVVRLLNANPNWMGFGVTTDLQAMELFVLRHFDVVLLGCGLTDESDTRLRERFLRHNPKVKIVQHYGGGSGLLFNEIESALAGN